MTDHPPIQILEKVAGFLRHFRYRTVDEAAACLADVEAALAGQTTPDPMREMILSIAKGQATSDSDHALSLLRSVCTPLDHNLEIQPGSATHRCIQAFLGGEKPSEIRVNDCGGAANARCMGDGQGIKPAHVAGTQSSPQSPSLSTSDNNANDPGQLFSGSETTAGQPDANDKHVASMPQTEAECGYSTGQPVELLPCPFCGNAANFDNYQHKLEPHKRKVICLHCGMTTPWHDTSQMAAGHWNARATERESGWQPIETAPADEDVLLYCPPLGMTNRERIELGHAHRSTGSHHAWATHWMPLPPMPDNRRRG